MMRTAFLKGLQEVILKIHTGILTDHYSEIRLGMNCFGGVSKGSCFNPEQFTVQYTLDLNHFVHQQNQLDIMDIMFLSFY